MNKNQYSLEELERTFNLHHIRSEELNKKLIKKFKEENPDDPIPDPFNDNFSLPLALAALTRAIIEIKEKMND